MAAEVENGAGGELLEHISSLFNQDRFHDMVVVCDDGTEFKTHKAVLCRFIYFARAIEGGFKEGITNRIELHEDDSRMVEIMLRFLYNPNYLFGPRDYSVVLCDSCHETGDGQLMFNIRVVAIAQKYLLPKLVEVAVEDFEIYFEEGWTLGVAIDAITELYNSIEYAASPLREVVVKHVARMASYFLEKEEDGSISGFEKLLSQTPELGVDLAIALSKKIDAMEANMSTVT